MPLKRYNPSYFPSNRAKIEVAMLKKILYVILASTIEVRVTPEVDRVTYRD
jgi:hypothetical protein